MFGGPLREIENVQYMHIYMLLILHPLPTPSFPRLPSPRYKLLDFRQGVLCTIGDLGLSGIWVYRGFCYRGVFFIGEKVIGDLGYRANVVLPLRLLRSHGLQPQELQLVARATTVASILYAAPAWWKIRRRGGSSSPGAPS